MNLFGGILEQIRTFFSNAVADIVSVFTAADTTELLYTAVARWLFIALAIFILLRAIISLLKGRGLAEVWAFLQLDTGENIPITHWENAVGRAKNCDIVLDDISVSRNHGILTRDNEGVWSYMDLHSKNGAIVNGVEAEPDEPVVIHTGDQLLLGETICTLFPVSVEEHMYNVRMREAGTKMLPPWLTFIAISVFQLLTVIQLKFALDDKYDSSITMAFGGLCVLMWVYVFLMKSMKRRGFEIETIAFFLSTLSLAVVATKYPDQTFRQFLTIAVGVVLFFFMCTYLRNLERTISIKKFMYVAASLLLIFNMFRAVTINGASNWVSIGGFTMQPSEIVKLAFIWVGAATMEELFERRNSLEFTIFAAFSFACLAKMGDFGTALIFFITFLVISFMRSGDFTKLILVVGAAFAAGLMVVRFKSYVAHRFELWGHVWQDPDQGFQQTRTMSASASGGLIGVGAGKGWLKHIFGSQTDLVFGLISEEWGLIIAVLVVVSIVTLSIFAFRSILSGRSTYYTIAACAGTTIFLSQTILNVFGSVDLLPLTGVTIPFVSAGGSSMIASWGLLAFLKAADTRQNASFAVSLKDRGLELERGVSS